MIALLRYHICMYASSFHFVFPFLLVLSCCVLFGLCLPSCIPGCFVLSLILLFVICMADGFYSQKLCSDTMDAVLILKTGSAVKYFFSKELFLSLLALIYAFLIMLGPVIVSVFGIGDTVQILTGELIGICFVHLLIALLGYEIGSLFHPYIIRRRKPAVILFLVTAVGIFIRPSLAGLPVVKYLFWLFPPVVELIGLIYAGETILPPEAGGLALQLALYTLFVLAIKGTILNSRKWTIFE